MGSMKASEDVLTRTVTVCSIRRSDIFTLHRSLQFEYHLCMTIGEILNSVRHSEEQ